MFVPVLVMLHKYVKLSELWVQNMLSDVLLIISLLHCVCDSIVQLYYHCNIVHMWKLECL